MSNNSKMLWGVVAVVVIAGGIYLFSQPKDMTQGQQQQENKTASATGRAVLSVTDAAMDMGDVTQVNIKVTSVDVHNPVDGWVNISSATKTYDLLALNASSQSALLADSNISAGTYDSVRLSVDSVTLKMKDGTFKTAKLPSDKLTLNTNFTVNADKTSNINFDFLADKSLHTTGNGTYIFTPVIKTKVTSDTKVDIDGDEHIKLTGGDDEGEEDEGMDVDGSFRSNFQIDKTDKLDIDAENHIKIGGRD